MGKSFKAPDTFYILHRRPMKKVKVKQFIAYTFATKFIEVIGKKCIMEGSLA